MKARLASAVLAVSALASGAALAQDNTLVINSFGGAYEEAHRQCIITPFEQETGAKVSITTAYSADAFAQLRAQKEAPQYDVIHFSGGQEIVGAAEGLLAPIDAAKVPNLGDLYDFAKANVAKGEGPAYSIAAIGLLYNSENAPQAPSSWQDVMDPAFSGLPAFLAETPGLQSGFMMHQVTAAALVSESKTLAHPASVDSIPTSANKEDHVSMGAWAARKAARVLDNAERVVAIELLAAAQGIDWLRPLRTSPALEAAHRAIRQVAAVYADDRPGAPDIEAAAELVRSGALVVLED